MTIRLRMSRGHQVAVVPAEAAVQEEARHPDHHRVLHTVHRLHLRHLPLLNLPRHLREAVTAEAAVQRAVVRKAAAPRAAARKAAVRRVAVPKAAAVETMIPAEKATDSRKHIINS